MDQSLTGRATLAKKKNAARGKPMKKGEDKSGQRRRAHTGTPKKTKTPRLLLGEASNIHEC